MVTCFQTTLLIKTKTELTFGGRTGNKDSDLLMNNATKSIANVQNLLETIPAANDDQIGESFAQTTTIAAPDSTSTGWDAYEVWRRFIKDARDRRRSES
jgi:hypothetical protein